MARNYCIEYGKQNGYEWIFVLDSNHFFTETLYNDIINNIKNDTEYITIPQKRVSDAKLENESILTSPEKIKNIPAQEHQLAFKNTSTYLFNEINHSNIAFNLAHFELLGDFVLLITNNLPNLCPVKSMKLPISNFTTLFQNLI